MSIQGWIFLVVVGFLIAGYVYNRRIKPRREVDLAQEIAGENPAPAPEDTKAGPSSEPAPPETKSDP